MGAPAPTWPNRLPHRQNPKAALLPSPPPGRPTSPSPLSSKPAEIREEGELRWGGQGRGCGRGAALAARRGERRQDRRASTLATRAARTWVAQPGGAANVSPYRGVKKKEERRPEPYTVSAPIIEGGKTGTFFMPQNAHGNSSQPNAEFTVDSKLSNSQSISIPFLSPAAFRLLPLPHSPSPFPSVSSRQIRPAAPFSSRWIQAGSGSARRRRLPFLPQAAFPFPR